MLKVLLIVALSICSQASMDDYLRAQSASVFAIIAQYDSNKVAVASTQNAYGLKPTGLDTPKDITYILKSDARPDFDDLDIAQKMLGFWRNKVRHSGIIKDISNVDALYITMINKDFHVSGEYDVVTYMEREHKPLNTVQVELMDYGKESLVQKAYMDSLANFESTTLHWNRNESTFTTPYGVYAKMYPNSRLVSFIKEYASNRGYDTITKSNVKEIDALLDSDAIELIRRLAWREVYEPIVMDRLFNSISRADTRKAYFNIAVTCGVSVARKMIRHTGTKCSPHQLCKTVWLRHYSKLSSRYNKYKRGWLRRLSNLGFKPSYRLKRRYNMG